MCTVCIGHCHPDQWLHQSHRFNCHSLLMLMLLRLVIRYLLDVQELPCMIATVVHSTFVVTLV